MENVSKIKKNIPVLFMFIIMILLAFCDNVRGVFIPVFKNEFGVNDTTIGMMLTISSVGYIVSSYIGGFLCEKIGQKKVAMIGFIFSIASLLGISCSKSFYVLLLGMFFLNVGQAFLAIAANTLIPILFVSYQAILMNITHFCYGAGSTFAQRFSGVMVHEGVSWRSIYVMIAAFAIMVFACFAFIKIPSAVKSNEKSNVNLKELCRNKLVYMYIMALGFYVFAEMATGNWFVNFMEKNYNYNESQSSFYVALFFGVFTVGRLVGGFIVEKTGYLRTVMAFMIIAVITYFAGLVIGEKGLIVISISGFFFSIVYPTLVLTISNVFKQNSAYVTGVVVTCSSFVSMMLNLVISMVNDKVNSYAAFFIIPFSLLISIISIFHINKQLKNQ